MRIQFSRGFRYLLAGIASVQLLAGCGGGGGGGGIDARYVGAWTAAWNTTRDSVQTLLQGQS